MTDTNGKTPERKVTVTFTVTLRELRELQLALNHRADRGMSAREYARARAAKAETDGHDEAVRYWRSEAQYWDAALPCLAALNATAYTDHPSVPAGWDHV